MPLVLPRTPGDQREDQAQAAADAVSAIYARLELIFLAAVAAQARRAAMGAMTAAVAQRQLGQAIAATFTATAPRVRQVIDNVAADATAQVRRMLGAAVGRDAALQVTAPDVTALCQSLDAAVDHAAAALRTTLTEAISTTVEPRQPVGLFTPYQAVQQAITGSRGGMPGSSLSLSRIQAAQRALDTLADHGVTGFVDKAGRRWDITSYVEMATRTAVSNAWDDMQTQAMIRTGLDLVEVATHSTEGSCPRCLPWLGRVLSLTGESGQYPSLDQARAAGFRHPNCRCFWVPLGAGVAREFTNPIPLNQAAAMYQAGQRQRALEREVRAAGRRMYAAITPAAKSRARRQLAAARARSAHHRENTGLRMTKASSRRREQPLAAR